MEWRSEDQAVEEALVKSNINMIGFVRYGCKNVSKSKTINNLLSPSGHDVFFHHQAVCGRMKRLLTNGTVEVTHFLPAAVEDDLFPMPALFFNLRGDCCKYPVQHSLVCDLVNVLVMFLDRADLASSLVQSRMKHVKQTQVIAVISNVTHQEIEDVDSTEEKIIQLLGNDVSVIKTYEHYDGSEPAIAEVIMDIREAIGKNMEKRPRKSIEQFKSSQHQGLVDEHTNQCCKHGKILAQRVLSLVQQSGDKAKRSLLPCQGDSLHDISELLKKLHRCSGRDYAPTDKDTIKSQMLDIRKKQAEKADRQLFMEEVLKLYNQESSVKAFAIKWLQEALDDKSRVIIPPLLKERTKLVALRQRKSGAPNIQDLLRIERELEEAERDLDAATFGMEHLLREMAQICEVEAELKQVKHSTSLPQIVGQLLVEGHPVEMMDGDHGLIPTTWLKAVFQSLNELIGEDKQIFVLSIMGIQSSGKSTLLSTMFNLEFAVSAGRCTRGIYGQLLPMAEVSKFDYMLILDSEGLRAQGVAQQGYQHDNELATLVIGMADLVLVNLQGENVTEVKDILQIVVQAFLRMKLADAPVKRKCMFIHQNVGAVNAIEKLAGERQKLKEQLDNMTEVACQVQNLPRALTSFDQLIEFDAENDVIYFPNLWNGNPPMATCDPRYSLQASKTRQQILEKIAQSRGNTVENFMQRMTDMWSGVLAEDFVFNFRNGIATKAYNDLEREFSKHQMEIEKNVLQFLNVECKTEQQKCDTEEDLKNCRSKQINRTNERFAELFEKAKRKQDRFFETHVAKDIMEQWKSEKTKSLMLAVEALKRDSKLKLESMYRCRLYEIREQNATLKHEQMVIAESRKLAEKLRGQDPTQSELEKEFQTMWTRCANDLDAAESSQNMRCIIDVLEECLWEVMGSNNEMFLKAQLVKTPVKADSSLEYIPEQDIGADYYTINGRPRAAKEKHSKPVAAVANNIMATVMAKVDKICHQDILFDLHHGKKIIRLTLEEVQKQNEQKVQTQNANTTLSLLPEFTAMLAVRVACCAAPKFDKMDAKYEEKHGVKTKLNKYKERVFKLFENAVKDATIEVIASADFCEVIKGQVVDHVRTQLDQKIMQEIHQALGTTKFDLILRVLDDISDKKDFNMLMQYVHRPLSFSEEWMHEFSKRHIFQHRTPSTYAANAELCAIETVDKILSSTRTATDAVRKSCTLLYHDWVAAFCDDITNTIPISSARLNTQYELKNLSQYQEAIESSLRDLETAIKDEFKGVTAESVQWANRQNPIQHVFERLWGCREMCPFCVEPCQYTDANHATNHRCIQHKPTGITGTLNVDTRKLTLETCNMKVANPTVTFRCSASSYQCRKRGPCDGQGKIQNSHRYREYHKYIPGWDIPPDPACEAANFWRWIMCYFKDKLPKRYPNTTIEIPDSWETISPDEAKSSLRKYLC